MATAAGPRAEPRPGGLGQFVRRLVGGASLLSLASILQQGIGFFLLPVYTRYLSPEDYGHIEVLMVSVFLALMVVGQGMPPSLLRSLTYVYADDERRGRAAAGTALAWIGLSGLGFFALVALLSRPLSTALLGTPEHADLVMIGGILVGTGAFISVASSILLAAQRVSLAVGVGLAQFAVKLALNILLIVVLEVGFAGIIWSQLAGEIVGMVGVLWMVRNRVTWNLRIGELRGLLGYGVPLIGSTLGQQVLSVSDRYVLRWLRPGAELGLYAVANKFSTAFFFIVLTPLFRMWEINSLELVSDREGARRISRLGSLYLILGTALVLAAMWLGEPVLRLILPPEFVAAEAAVGILIAGSVFHGLGEIFKVGMRATGAAGRQAMAAAAAAVLNLGLTVLMVPPLGFVGAAISTVLSFAAYAGLNAFAARGTVSIPWDRSRLLFGTVLLLAICCAQPWLVQIDPAARFVQRGWLLLAYLVLSPLMLDEETRAALADRLRPGLRRMQATTGGGGRA